MVTRSLPISKLGLRDLLALGITIISVIGVITLAWAALEAGEKSRVELVLSAVLPLLGSWVGTVLAYYFSKDNFEAAHRGLSDMVDKVTQKELISIPVTDKMIKLKDIYYIRESEINKEEANLFQLLQKIEGSKGIWTRLPIFGDQNQVKHLFHRHQITRFLVKKYNEKTDMEKLTLGDLLNDSEFKDVTQLFAIVNKEATLADAKEKMDKLPNCKDIFITEKGQEDEPILGWITNDIIFENAKL